MALGVSETMTPVDNPVKRERVDVRKESQRIRERYEKRISDLRTNVVDEGVFRDAAMKATETFKGELKDFLTANGAGDLYDQLVGFTSGKVAEVTQPGKESAGI